VGGVYFCTLCPSICSKEGIRQTLDRLPLVSNFLTHFWMQQFDGARPSPNSVRNAVWRALNEHVCQYLRMRNPRCSTVYIDKSLGPLGRDSPRNTSPDRAQFTRFIWTRSHRITKIETDFSYIVNAKYK